MKDILGSALLMGALALTGCDNKDVPSGTSTPTAAQAVTMAAPPPHTSVRDPALPDPATAAVVEDAAEKARAMPGKPPVNPNANALKPMTKQEESTAMPMAGQVNEHSTTALDKKKSP